MAGNRVTARIIDPVDSAIRRRHMDEASSGTMGIGPLSPTVTPHPQPSFPSTLELRLLLVHMHDAGHVRMHGADVTEVTFADKSMLELVVGIQALGSKTLVVAVHGMR